MTYAHQIHRRVVAGILILASLLLFDGCVSYTRNAPLIDVETTGNNVEVRP